MAPGGNPRCSKRKRSAPWGVLTIALFAVVVIEQLSGKTKQLVSDVGTLRTLLVSLTHYDCVTFHCVVRSLRTTEQALRTAGWMLLDAAETLFVTARARVFGPPRTAPDAAAP